MFLQYLSQNGSAEDAPHYAANYLWNERLFGMKIKRLGPTILASETIIPILSRCFYRQSEKTGRHFGVEIVIDCYIIESGKALIMCNYLCDSRKMKYYINVPLVAVITKAAVRAGRSLTG